MQTEHAVCWGAEFPWAGEAEVVVAVTGSVTQLYAHVYPFPAKPPYQIKPALQSKPILH